MRALRLVLAIAAVLLAVACVNALFPRSDLDRAGVDAMYERGRR